MAQTHLDGGATCLNLGEKAGQSLAASWTHSFGVFLDTYQGELSEGQNLLVQEAIHLGSSRSTKLDRLTSIHVMKSLLVDARKALSADQFSELLARMGPESQRLLKDIGVIAAREIACSCTVGASSGCPEGFPCTVGCTTWGTGAWNGVCVRQAVVVPQ